MLVAHMVSVHVKAMRCAHQLMRMLKEASADDRRRASDYDDLLKALFAVHPVAMLDEMFTGDAKSVTTGCRFIEALARRRASPLDGVPPDTLMLGASSILSRAIPLQPPAVFFSGRTTKQRPCNGHLSLRFF
jgi:hypothetical protein